MNIRELARESKKVNNHPDLRLQVTHTIGAKTNTGFNTYRVYGNERFQDNNDEYTIGFIDSPMTIRETEGWLHLLKRADGSFIGSPRD